MCVCECSGTVVGQINATDKDEPNTSHTKIRYILLTGTELFSVHSFSGVISTKSATLDREVHACRRTHTHTHTHVNKYITCVV